MPTDDELLAALGEALAPPHREPTEDRVAALRRRAEAMAGAATPAFTTAARPSPGRRWRIAAAVVAAAAVFGAGFVTADLVSDNDAGDTTALGGEVEFSGRLTAPRRPDVGGEATVVKTGIGRVIRFDTTQLPILPTGEYYELWFVAANDSTASPNRISAGTFHPDADGRSQVAFAAAADPLKFPTLVVTAEPGDGNPLATGPVVLQVRLGPA